MNVLVTGANGFIGRALCKRMLADGYQARGAVRDGRQMTVLPSGVERTQIGNIGPKTDWSKALAGIDGIVHLAARVHVMHDSAADPLSAFRQVNVAGTERLAQQAAEAGVKRMVYLSSVKVNGEGSEDRACPPSVWRGQKSELARRQSGGVGGQGSVSKEFFSEKDVPDPQDPYAVSKCEAERVLREVAVDTGLEVVILRPPLVYGPGARGNLLKLQRLVSTGLPMPLASIKNRRSLIYVGNLVDAIITCLVHPKAAGETFLVSDGRDLSTSELIRLMAEAMGRKACLLPFPPSLLKIMGKLTGRSAEIERVVGSLCVDSSKIMLILGWKPLFTVEEGIRKTFANYAGK